MDKKQILARNLANFYKTKDESYACACLGIDCLDLGCAHWWEEFLDLPAKDIQKMVRIYLILKRNW